MSTSTKSKRFTEVKLGVKLPVVYSTGDRWSYRRTPVFGVTQSLAEKVDGFTQKVVLFQRAGDDTKYVRQDKNFPTGGGKPADVRRKFQAVVDHIDAVGEDTITNIWTDRWDGSNTLYVNAYVPASQEDLDLFEAEKLRAQALADEVAAAKAKYKVEEKARRAKQAEVDRKARAARKKQQQKAEAERKAKEAAEAEANTIGHALKVLTEAGYKVEVKSPAEKKATPKKK